MEILKGSKHYCKNTVIMDDGEYAYIEGNVYMSENDFSITDESGDTNHSWGDDADEPTKTAWEYYEYFEPMEDSPSFKTITDGIASLLEYKNEKYGNAVANPLDIFTGKCKAGTRLDDKLSRVKNSPKLRKNDIADIMGYLVHVCIENGWYNFDEYKD